MVDIVSKTLAKMSPAGGEAAGTIALSPDLAAIVERALLATPPGGSRASSGPGSV